MANYKAIIGIDIIKSFLFISTANFMIPRVSKIIPQNNGLVQTNKQLPISKEAKNHSILCNSMLKTSEKVKNCKENLKIFMPNI